MKRGLIFVGLLLALFVSSFVIYGCGTSTSTTTATLPVSQTSTAKASMLVASGGASAGTSTNTVGGSASSSPRAYSVNPYWVRSFVGNPPAAFFTQDMRTSTDGYFNPVGSTLLGGNVTPYIRLINTSNEVIAGSYFSSDKKIAIFPGCSVEAIFAGSPTQAPVGIVDGVASFLGTWMTTTSGGSTPAAGYASSSLFAPITTMGDYLCWAYIYATMESVMTTRSYGGRSWPAGAHITTPEADDSEDYISAMDNKMVYTGPVSGEIVVRVPTLSDGRAQVGTWYGTGQLTTPVATLDVTTGITFSSPAGNPPTMVTFIGTNETAPLYTTIVYITSPSNGTGTGEIWEGGSKIGTIIISSTGGSLTIGSTTETITF